jgi:hypothetical protein
MQQKNIKTSSGSSPNFALSNHIAYSNTQAGAAVPLKVLSSKN